ncbi:hypothetical protein B0T24DRAFT_206982, partial [Lasiosphaeria ovina]
TISSYSPFSLTKHFCRLGVRFREKRRNPRTYPHSPTPFPTQPILAAAKVWRVPCPRQPIYSLTKFRAASVPFHTSSTRQVGRALRFAICDEGTSRTSRVKACPYTTKRQHPPKDRARVDPWPTHHRAGRTHGHRHELGMSTNAGTFAAMILLADALFAACPGNYITWLGLAAPCCVVLTLGAGMASPRVQIPDTSGYKGLGQALPWRNCVQAADDDDQARLRFPISDYSQTILSVALSLRPSCISASQSKTLGQPIKLFSSPCPRPRQCSTGATVGRARRKALRRQRL